MIASKRSGGETPAGSPACRVLWLGGLLGAFALSGCALRGGDLGIDWSVVEVARFRLADTGRIAARVAGQGAFGEDPEVVIVDEGGASDGEKPGVASAVLGELLAIFPGVVVPGIGHYYAGDRATGSRLLRIGEFGWLLTVVGGGLVVGGYALDKNDLEGTAYGLYGTGGFLGAIGLTYVLTAWFYDMIDTPRAVLSGGEPPPHSDFVESLDFFDQ